LTPGTWLAWLVGSGAEAQAAGHAAEAGHGGGHLWGEQHTLLYWPAKLLHDVFVSLLQAGGVSEARASDLGEAFFQPFLVNTWLLCVGLIVLAYFVRKTLQRGPRGDVAGFMEMVVESLYGFVRGAIGPGGEEHAPFIASLFVFITTANWMGLIPGLMSPIGVSGEEALTGLNTTAGLALTAIVYVHYVAIRKTGLKSYLMHFVGEPVWLAPLNVPMHLIGELARPLSLAFRLFGNIGGEDKVLHLLAVFLFLAAFPLHAPMTLFGVFTGLLQAYVFTALTCSYIAGFLEHHQEEHGEGHAEPEAAHA